MTLVAWPAVGNKILEVEQWVKLRQRTIPWSNASLVLLWVTGFVQMTGDANYEGFLALGSLWAKAILIKHVAVLGMMGFGVYIQWRLHPALARLVLVEKKHPESASKERDKLAKQEARLLRLNLVCAVAVLFFTAVATAV
jgi:hypothetical protein